MDNRQLAAELLRLATLLVTSEEACGWCEEPAPKLVNFKDWKLCERCVKKFDKGSRGEYEYGEPPYEPPAGY